MFLYGSVLNDAGTARYAPLSGLVLTAALHASAIALLLQLEPVHSASKDTPPIMVRLISPPRIEESNAPPAPRLVSRVESSKPKPKPRVERARRTPRPRAVQPTPVPKPPVVSAPSAELPSFSPPQPKPVATREREPVEPAPPVASPAPPAPAARPALPMTPPSFNAAYLDNPPPQYPALSRRIGEEGKVVLRVFVTDTGVPATVQLKSSSGFSRLDGVAVETVKRWKFVPARRGKQPVAAWVIVPISFSLRS